MNKNPHTRKKEEQLGMSYGSACHQMRKRIMYSLAVECGKNICVRCGTPITNVDDFSIEHLSPWLDSDDPVGKFFDMTNIGFSHTWCNSACSRKTVPAKHPSISAYTKGCRCDACTKLQRDRMREYRERHKKAKK